jgi:hypothetical protein
MGKSSRSNYEKEISMNLGWLAITPLLLCQSSEAAWTSSEKDYLQVIAEAYQQNREAFPFLSCRFRLIRGQARNPEEAYQGKLLQSFSLEGHWLVHGSKVKFTLLAIPDAIPLVNMKQKDGTEIEVPAAQTRLFLTNGQYTLCVSHCYGVGNIYSPEIPHPGVALTPFDMGIMGNDEQGNPARIIEKCLRRGYFCHYEGRQKMASIMTAVVSATPYEKTDPGRVNIRYAFDPRRGFLPVCIETQRAQTGQWLSKLWMTDVRECSGGRWFPWRSVLYDYYSVPFVSNFYNVRIIEVVELEVDRPPADEEFYLDLHAGTTIYAPTTEGPGDTQFTLPVATRVGLGDLERVWRRCLLQESSGGLELLEERGWPWLAILVVVTLAALVTAILGLALRLRRGGIR